MRVVHAHWRPAIGIGDGEPAGVGDEEVRVGHAQRPGDVFAQRVLDTRAVDGRQHAAQHVDAGAVFPACAGCER